jgi:hypothetical protein
LRSNDHFIAAPRTDLDEPPLHSLPAQSILQAHNGALVLEVGLGHPALHDRTLHEESTAALTNGERLSSRTQHDVRFSGVKPCSPHHQSRQLLSEGLDPLPRESGHHHRLADLAKLGHTGVGLAGIEKIALRGNHQPRTPAEVRIVCGHFSADRGQIGERIIRGEVDHEGKGSAPRDVAKETVAEALTLVCPFNQAGHIGHHVAFSVPAGNAQIRLERRERVRGNLRVCCGETRKQRRLPGVGEPHQPEVGDEPELELHVPFFSALARFGCSRDSIPMGSQRRVASSTPSAASGHNPASGPHQVSEEPTILPHDRSIRHMEHEVAPVRPSPIVPLTVTRVPRSLVGVLRQVGQVEDLGRDLQDDVAASSSVTAVGTALRPVFLPVEGHGALPTPASTDVDHCLIDKRRHGASIGSPMNPEPVDAWFVRARDRGDAGAVTLRLEEGALSLSTPDEELRLETSAILRVRRAKLSPVISIVYMEGGRRSKVFIYFAPPSLNTWTERRFGTRGSVERAAEAVRLAQANRELKPLVEEWAEAIRRAATFGV